ncbi:MAG: peptide deformylase [Kiritimatiellia bacterium]|jgi:peptide deformylase
MPMRITQYGEEILRQKARPVVDFTPELANLVKRMLKTMYAANGVGLAAEQVGETCALCVIDVPAEVECKEYVEGNASIPMPLVLVNPTITAREGEQRDDEGCLSFPEITALVTRALHVTVRYQDVEGHPHEITAHGLLARAVQHELDHLDGVLFIDHISPLQKVAIAGKLRRLQKESAAAAKLH